MRSDRFLLLTCLGIILTMGDPSFLPANQVNEPEVSFKNNVTLKEVDATLIQMEEEQTLHRQRSRNERINFKNSKIRTPANSNDP